MKIPRARHQYYVLDEKHRVWPAKFEEWMQWYEGSQFNGSRLVGWTQITSQVEVSTVFLGIDHRWIGKGPPIVFETMIFGGPLNHEQWRYSSWDDADAGHKAAVRKARRVQQRLEPKPADSG